MTPYLNSNGGSWDSIVFGDDASDFFRPRSALGFDAAVPGGVRGAKEKKLTWIWVSSIVLFYVMAHHTRFGHLPRILTMSNSVSHYDYTERIGFLHDPEPSALTKTGAAGSQSRNAPFAAVANLPGTAGAGPLERVPRFRDHSSKATVPFVRLTPSPGIPIPTGRSQLHSVNAFPPFS